MARNGSGFVIIDLWNKLGAETGMRWEARAWDHRAKKYRYQSFPDKMPDAAGTNGYAAADTWARNKVAELRLGMDTASTVSLAKVAKAYDEDLKDSGRCKEHRREISRLVERLVAAGIDEMSDKDFPRKVKTFIVGMTDGHKLRQKGLSWKDEDGKSIKRGKKPRAHEPRPLAASTKHKYLGHIKSVAGFAVTWDWLMKNPMDKVELPVVKTTKETFKVDEIRKLVRPGADRFWLPFCLLSYAGLRIGEALHLRWEWIDWDANRIYVRKHPDYRLKGGKERSVPLQAELRAILEDKKRRRDIGWIVDDAELRQMIGVPKGDAKPDSKALWEIFREYCSGRGVEPGDRSAHSTRHTWVSLMLASGEDSAFVQVWAGHSKIDTTLEYSAAKEALRDAVKGWGRGELRLQPTGSPVARKAS